MQGIGVCENLCVYIQSQFAKKGDVIWQTFTLTSVLIANQLFPAPTFSYAENIFLEPIGHSKKVNANRDNSIKINIGLYSLQHATGCMPTVLQSHRNKN